MFQKYVCDYKMNKGEQSFVKRSRSKEEERYSERVKVGRKQRDWRKK